MKDDKKEKHEDKKESKLCKKDGKVSWPGGSLVLKKGAILKGLSDKMKKHLKDNGYI